MNRVVLQTTVFTNYPSGDKTYGYRIYDGHGQSYHNGIRNWSAGDIPNFPEDDLDILRDVIEAGVDDITSDMFSFIAESKSGMYIGDNWYDWGELKEILHDFA